MDPENPVLLDIFSYSCMNCLRSLDYIKKINKKYGKYGLNTILIHPPEWEFEKNKNNITNALKKYNISFPIILDKDKNLIKKLGIDFWPTQALIHNNQIVYKHIGEGNYKLLEKKIRQILGVNPKKIFSREPMYSKFPTIYLGKKKKGKIIHKKGILRFGLIYADGKWVQTGEYFQHIGKKGSLAIVTKGSIIYAVAKAKKKANVLVTVDNKQHRKITVSNPNLYLIAKLKDNRCHNLTLTTKRNLAVYSFAFR